MSGMQGPAMQRVLHLGMSVSEWNMVQAQMHSALLLAGGDGRPVHSQLVRVVVDIDALLQHSNHNVEHVTTMTGMPYTMVGMGRC